VRYSKIPAREGIGETIAFRSSTGACKRATSYTGCVQWMYEEGSTRDLLIVDGCTSVRKCILASFTAFQTTFGVVAMSARQLFTIPENIWVRPFMQRQHQRRINRSGRPELPTRFTRRIIFRDRHWSFELGLQDDRRVCLLDARNLPNALGELK